MIDYTNQSTYSVRFSWVNGGALFADKAMFLALE